MFRAKGVTGESGTSQEDCVLLIPLETSALKLYIHLRCVYQFSLARGVGLLYLCSYLV